MPDFEAPQTYAEWYWANQLDVFMADSIAHEKDLLPAVNDIFSLIPAEINLPPALDSLITKMQIPEGGKLGSTFDMFVASAIDRVNSFVMGEELRSVGYAMADIKQDLLMTPEIANALMLRKKITPEFWLRRMNQGGYSEEEATHIYETLKPYPSMPDIISWARYQETPDSPKAKAWEIFDISEKDFPVWEWLSRMKLNTEQVQTLYKRKAFSDYDADLEFAQLGWQGLDKFWIKALAYSIPNAMLLTQGNLFQGASREKILNEISVGDIHPTYAETYLDAIQIKPSSIDLVAYELRRDPSLNNLGRELGKTGVHPDYHDLYKELAYQIPPVADIITMAVREAFTPDIARRFGQYQDLPDEFVKAVGKKGLSEEWAARYWAAHWSLPSAQQGNEMLHRGIITRSELTMLLRALDIMPFWRDKMVEIAYRPLTRVDVRRMYGLGTLDESGINRAYRDLGYNDFNAEKMTDFTVKYTRQTQSRFSSGDVVTAYTNYLIDSGEATEILRDLGIKSTEVQNIIEKAEYKRTWSTKQETIDAIKNLYKKGKYDETETRRRLGDLTLPDDYIDTQLQQWEAKSKAEVIATWTTAQTLSFLKKRLINETRARKEFVDLGYDEEHINVYIASTIPAP